MRTISNLPYRHAAGHVAPGSIPVGPRHVADLHLPDAGDAGDVLVWFHGGGLTEGDKVGEEPMLARLTGAGIAVVLANYRLMPTDPWPACLEDAAAVVAWATHALAPHGFNLRRLFLGGMSAGAYLAAMIALDKRWLAAYGRDPSCLSGVIPISGQMASHFTYRAQIGHPQDRPLIDHAAPLWHVRPDAPPFLLIVGGNDLPCRLEENRYLEAALRQVGHHAVACLVVPMRDHTTIFPRSGSGHDPVAHRICTFLGI
jgi:acetyl esterase/lipase